MESSGNHENQRVTNMILSSTWCRVGNGLLPLRSGQGSWLLRLYWGILGGSNAVSFFITLLQLCSYGKSNRFLGSLCKFKLVYRPISLTMHILHLYTAFGDPDLNQSSVALACKRYSPDSPYDWSPVSQQVRPTTPTIFFYLKAAGAEQNGHS